MRPAVTIAVLSIALGLEAAYMMQSAGTSQALSLSALFPLLCSDAETCLTISYKQVVQHM